MLDYRLMIDGELDETLCRDRLRTGAPAGRCGDRLPNSGEPCEGSLDVVEIDQLGRVPMAVFVCSLCGKEYAKPIRSRKPDLVPA